MIGRGILAGALAFVAVAWMDPRAAGARPTPAPSSLFDLRVPGGTTGLLAAAGLRAPTEPSLALLPLIRALHARPLPTADDRRRSADVTAYLAAHATREPADETVPLPLSPDLWLSAVFDRRVPPDDLLSAILADRRAAFCYYGLMSLDEPTLAFFAGDPQLVADIFRHAAPAFAVYGRSLHVREGVVVVPGGAPARGLWEQLVGEPASDVHAFILAVLTRRAGRCAYFYDTVAHLDGPRQAFALHLGCPDRLRRVRALYDVFSRFAAQTWGPAESPFGQLADDPRATLMRVQATADGEMAAPAQLALWKVVFDGAAGCGSLDFRHSASPAADAAWLVERVAAQNPERRAQMVETLAFAHRVFDRPIEGEASAVCEVLVGFPAYQGLLLTLEATGGFSAADYLAAVRAASRLTLNDHGPYIAQLQGALAIVERAVFARSLERTVAARLVRTLLATPAGSGQVAAWMREALLPALGCSVETADDCLSEAVSGPLPDNQPVISWEGERYRIDYRASGRERMRRVRREQQANALSEVLAIDAATAAARGPAGGAEAGRQMAVLRDAANRVTLDATDRFGVSPVSPASVLAAAAQAASRPAGGDRDGARPLADARDLADVLLADALTSFAYAMAISEPDSSLLLAGDPARRHNFGRAFSAALRPNGPWRVPEERRSLDGQWIVQGSLFGLNRLLARFSVRRLSLDPGALVPSLDERNARAFAESALVLDACALADTDRDRLVEAIRAGRLRLPSLVNDTTAFERASAGIGISEWRWTAARWTAGRAQDRVADLFSLTELFWLGLDSAPSAGGRRTADGPNAWGVSTRTLDGAWQPWLPAGQTWESYRSQAAGGMLATQVADLHLRIAQCLAELRLPSSLAAGVAAYAVWDFLTETQMVDAEDWLAAVAAARRLTPERVADYVSALTAPDGPLVPVKSGPRAPTSLASPSIPQ